MSTGVQVTTSYEQCLELPRANATTDGKPVQGTKSNTTKALEKRYANATPPIIITSLKSGWVPETVVMEGMFLINITPWSAHKNIGEYADFLIRQHILPHFRGMSKQVHLLFDDPDCQEMSPKYFERQYRDLANHSCMYFSLFQQSGGITSSTAENARENLFVFCPITSWKESRGNLVHSKDL